MKTETPIIANLIAHVESECRAVDTEKLFDEMLDECYSFEKVGGCFAYMQPSRVLKECDPTAYRCVKNDYVDGLGLIELNGSEYQAVNVDKAAGEFIDGLRSELTDLETEREAIEGDQEAEIRRLDSAIADKEAEIEACEQHQW